MRVFDEWLAERIAESNWEAVLNYRKIAPHAEKNHPTDEHLLPLFVALGAGAWRVTAPLLPRNPAIYSLQTLVKI